MYMNIRNGAIYHSKENNKAVRVVRAFQDEQIAYVKHHNQENRCNIRSLEVNFDSHFIGKNATITDVLTGWSGGPYRSFIKN